MMKERELKIGGGTLLAFLLLLLISLRIIPSTDPLLSPLPSLKRFALFPTETIRVYWKPCSWWSSSLPLPALPEKSNGFLMVECYGGLNQMRRDLCDAVAVARLLNATLLLPHFDGTPYWNDSSGFADIFDADFFIEQMKDFLHIVRKLPERIAFKKPVVVECHKRKTLFDYAEVVLPALIEHEFIAITPAASQRNDRYPSYAKAARCQACYNSIRLVSHLKQKATQMLQKIPQPFLALHLRFEPDMIAYSRCKYANLSESSVKAIEGVREREPFEGEDALAWQRRGKCPLTPQETAFILESLKIPKDMPIYLATGDGLLETESFTASFRNIYTKSNLLDRESLTELKGNSKAALDYYISVKSDAYIATFFGNMDKMVLAMRALEGNSNSLILNRKAMASVMIRNLDGPELSKAVWKIHRDAFVSGRGTALPDCFCEKILS